jgi:hypothetical protein
MVRMEWISGRICGDWVFGMVWVERNQWQFWPKWMDWD